LSNAKTRRSGARWRRGAPVPDVVAPGLELLLVGINPGRISAARHAHFANPQNPFWRLLHESGLVPVRLDPSEQRELLKYGIGITNLVARETASAAELEPEDFALGRRRLASKLDRWKPRAVAFVGVTAYRGFSGLSAAKPLRLGEQAERLQGARLFVLPNPSGRNAHYQFRDMLELFTSMARKLRSETGRQSSG
jgi:TDG/mug DNA glycosylase family protein